jgi:hypothetical protein
MVSKWPGNWGKHHWSGRPSQREKPPFNCDRRSPSCFRFPSSFQKLTANCEPPGKRCSAFSLTTRPTPVIASAVAFMTSMCIQMPHMALRYPLPGKEMKRNEVLVVWRWTSQIGKAKTSGESTYTSVGLESRYRNNGTVSDFSRVPKFRLAPIDKASTAVQKGARMSDGNVRSTNDNRL